MSGEDDSVGVRSAWSIRFEVRMKACALPATTLSRAALDLSRFPEFASHMALVEVGSGESRLLFRHVGPGLTQFFDRDLTDSDYLDIVAPSTRQSAYVSGVAMSLQPCGLWQITPARTHDGQTVLLEYTAFPLAKDEENVGLIVFFVRPILHPDAQAPRLVAVQQSTSWRWIDLGHGVPTLA